jgi:hypothetical protein
MTRPWFSGGLDRHGPGLLFRGVGPVKDFKDGKRLAWHRVTPDVLWASSARRQLGIVVQML